MPANMKSIKSNVVAVTQSLSSRLKAAESTGRVWQFLAIGIGFLGAVGIGGSYFIERHRNTKIRDKKMDVLAEYYRFQVAATLGMSPEKISASDLKLAAQINPALAQAIDKVNVEKQDSDRANGMTSGGMLAVGAGFIPGLSGLGGIARVGAEIGGAVVGGAAAGLFTKDILHVNDMVEHIDDKLKSGKPIDTLDIAMLRAAQDEQWQKSFKEQYKTPFHKMDPKMQQQILAGMPQLVAGAEKQAYALNSGLISPQSLVMEGAATTTTNHADKMQRRAAVGGSHVQSETTRRLAAAQQQVSMN